MTERLSVDFDVIVIGGSLAGAAVAQSLGARGRRVLVIDRAEFPRRKACGEGLSATGMAGLRRLGFGAALDETAGLPFRGYEIWHGERRTPVGRDSGKAAGVGIERFRLDAALIDTCSRHSTVQLRFGEVARVAEVSDDRVRVDVGGESFTAHFLIIADGRDSTAAKALGIEEELRGVPRYGIALRFRGEFQKLPEHVQVILGDTFQAFLTPISPTLLNVSLLGARGGTNLRPVAESLAFSSLVNSIAGFKGEPEGTVLGKRNLQHGRRKPVYRRALLVGDAAEHLDPIAGMGMTHAILSGELAGECIESALAGRVEDDAALRRYQTERERLARPLRGFTGITYGALTTMTRHPRFMGLAMSHFGHQFSRAMRESRGEAMLQTSLAHLSLSLIGAWL